MTPEQRQELEKQIKNSFAEEQERLDSLKQEIQTEEDVDKRSEKESEVQQLESDLSSMKQQIEILQKLSEEEIQSLKDKLETIKVSLSSFGGELGALQESVLNGKDSKEGEVKQQMSTTYELLKDSNTCNRLRDIITNNPSEFKNVPGETAEQKLEYVFEKIRRDVVLFLESKLGKTDSTEKIINNTIAPALEWNLMTLLRDQGNETNIGMLKKVDKISWDNMKQLLQGVGGFAKTFSGSYSMANSWINALDYLSLQKDLLFDAECSKVLTDPVEFQNYLNSSIFSDEDFSPYASISSDTRRQLFKIDYNQDFEFGMTTEQQEKVLNEIGNIQVVPNPKTTALIVGMLDKPEKFLGKAPELQQTVNVALDGLNNVSEVTKIFGWDIIGEISKAPAERSFWYKIMDFVCKLLGFSGGFEGIVKKWRLDRMELDGDKILSIKSVISDYQEKLGANQNVTINNQESCNTVLQEFRLSDLDKTSSTRGDMLRDAMAEKLNISSLSPVVVQATLGNDYVENQPYIDSKGNKQTKMVAKTSAFDAGAKLHLAHKHIENMRNYLLNYKDLSDFYKDIHTIDDLAVCMTTSLYCNQNDVIEGVKAQVFMPENYRELGVENNGAESGLSSVENLAEQQVSEQYICDKAKEYGVTDNRQIAYILATVKGECNFKNIPEVGGDNQNYGSEGYYGRGFVQLTHKRNYEKFTNIIRQSGKEFKDNNGNVLSSEDLDLVANPDTILHSNDLSSFILVYGMKNGLFTGKSLDDFITKDKTDFYNARSIINGMTSKPALYSQYANEFLAKLNHTEKENLSRDVLIGPELLASNKDEIGGIGNSIMFGFQGYKNKTDFPNMDGDEGKSTQTHPHRFRSLEDVKHYKSEHSGVKSFMMYFGANTRDNEKTLADIKQRSEWLSLEGIQPVLCTCIGTERHEWLKQLNSDLIALGKEKQRPVFDFSSRYDKQEIVMGGDHPTSEGYSIMAGYITDNLKS